MGTSEDSCIAFVASPPPMGLPVYKDLPKNQAFVAAKYLKNMARTRLLVCIVGRNCILLTLAAFYSG